MPRLPQPSFYEEVGRNISRKRCERDLSQTELARLAGVHRNTICRWERGDGISLYDFLLVCDALSISFVKMLPDNVRLLPMSAHRALVAKIAMRERDPKLSEEEAAQLLRPMA